MTGRLRFSGLAIRQQQVDDCPQRGEAPGGFEPPYRGFADLCLTTWLRRREGV